MFSIEATSSIPAVSESFLVLLLLPLRAEITLKLFSKKTFPQPCPMSPGMRIPTVFFDIFPPNLIERHYFLIGPPFFSQSGMPPTLRTF